MRNYLVYICDGICLEEGPSKSDFKLIRGVGEVGQFFFLVMKRGGGVQTPSNLHDIISE